PNAGGVRGTDACESPDATRVLAETPVSDDEIRVGVPENTPDPVVVVHPLVHLPVLPVEGAGYAA
ncbi:hypothetical protein ACUHMQ_20595, partial [Chitinimonas sp. PSY-7]|uniref:hypothetical protein n=1 Tax=Chitinimonas sp. PSY-7 TaxID=3459088 RepID=UPI0040402787